MKNNIKQATGKSNAGYIQNQQTGEFEFADLPIHSVDTFIGVGCPGAFEGDSLYISCMQEHGQAVLNY